MQHREVGKHRNSKADTMGKLGGLKIPPEKPASIWVALANETVYFISPEGYSSIGVI